MGSIWCKIYNEVDITINDVSWSSSETSVSSNIKYVPGRSESVSVSYPIRMPVGIGRSVLTYGTRYESRPGPSTLKFENTPASTIHVIKIKHTNGDLNLLCMSESRQKDIVDFLKSKKQIQVRFLLGMPLIPEINYNAWIESPPLLFVTMCVPTILLTVVALQFV